MLNNLVSKLEQLPNTKVLQLRISIQIYFAISLLLKENKVKP